MTDAMRDTIAKIVCCPGGCILATCGDDACVALNPESTMLLTADAILAVLAAQPLTGCLHPGNEPKSCQYEGQCLSLACNHNGKVWYGPRMTLEAQDPNVLYPPKETT